MSEQLTNYQRRLLGTMPSTYKRAEITNPVYKAIVDYLNIPHDVDLVDLHLIFDGPDSFRIVWNKKVFNWIHDMKPSLLADEKTELIEAIKAAE